MINLVLINPIDRVTLTLFFLHPHLIGMNLSSLSTCRRIVLGDLLTRCDVLRVDLALACIGLARNLLVAGKNRGVLCLIRGLIGAVLVKNQSGTFQTASLSLNEPSSGPITRDLGASVAQPPRALVRFSPDARVADITALLNTYQASIVDGVKDGMFRLQFGNKAMGKDEAASLVSRLASEKIVSLAVATP